MTAGTKCVYCLSESPTVSTRRHHEHMSVHAHGVSRPRPLGQHDRAPPCPGSRAHGTGPASRPAGSGAGRRGAAPAGPRPETAIRGTPARRRPRTSSSAAGRSTTDCASCHAPPICGHGDGKNPNLLQSGVALRDRKASSSPPVQAHASHHADRGRQRRCCRVHPHRSLHHGRTGQPSPHILTNVTLNVLVGNAKTGEATFDAVCGACHSVTGNLEGIAAKFANPRALQNGWVSGSTSTFGGGRGAAVAATFPRSSPSTDGSKLEGTLVREDSLAPSCRSLARAGHATACRASR